MLNWVTICFATVHRQKFLKWPKLTALKLDLFDRCGEMTSHGVTSFGHFSPLGSSRRPFDHRFSVDNGNPWYKKSIQCFLLDWPRIPRFFRDSSQRKSLALRARDLLAEESLKNRGIRGQSRRKHWIPSIYSHLISFSEDVPRTGTKGLKYKMIINTVFKACVALFSKVFIKKLDRYQLKEFRDVEKLSKKYLKTDADINFLKL